MQRLLYLKFLWDGMLFLTGSSRSVVEVERADLSAAGWSPLKDEPKKKNLLVVAEEEKEEEAKSQETRVCCKP